ncbi:hypothetical protein K438DRAFT_2012798 [Mycena galopus ATCC 62051]|nr:hypothetical protein K438DRAFT_2012798 [Mycena galopus ATCC 62051]
MPLSTVLSQILAVSYEELRDAACAAHPRLHPVIRSTVEDSESTCNCCAEMLFATVRAENATNKSTLVHAIIKRFLGFQVKHDIDSDPTVSFSPAPRRLASVGFDTIALPRAMLFEAWDSPSQGCLAGELHLPQDLHFYCTVALKLCRYWSNLKELVP